MKDSKDTDMSDNEDQSDTEDTPINKFLKDRFNTITSIFTEGGLDLENEESDVEFQKKYHEKYFKLFK
jgi:hypothetical protein